jgi:hypothetical protein
VFASKPDTTPDDEPTFTKLGELLLHTPPATASLNVVVSPTHTESTPVIAAGAGFTVTVLANMHPPPNVYAMEAVPADKPVTTPLPVAIMATDVALLLHIPPDTASDMVITAPSHKLPAPPIASGIGFTVKTNTVLQPVFNV